MNGNVFSVQCFFFAFERGIERERDPFMLHPAELQCVLLTAINKTNWFFFNEEN